MRGDRILHVGSLRILVRIAFVHPDYSELYVKVQATMVFFSVLDQTKSKI